MDETSLEVWNDGKKDQGMSKKVLGQNDDKRFSSKDPEKLYKSIEQSEDFKSLFACNEQTLYMYLYI